MPGCLAQPAVHYTRLLSAQSPTIKRCTGCTNGTSRMGWRWWRSPATRWVGRARVPRCTHPFLPPLACQRAACPMMHHAALARRGVRASLHACTSAAAKAVLLSTHSMAPLPNCSSSPLCLCPPTDLRLQFGSQEPGSNQEIGAFVASRYGVQFPLMSKSLVNGPQVCVAGGGGAGGGEGRAASLRLRPSLQARAARVGALRAIGSRSMCCARVDQARWWWWLLSLVASPPTPRPLQAHPIYKWLKQHAPPLPGERGLSCD